jgi:hypothetical protein
MMFVGVHPTNLPWLEHKAGEDEILVGIVGIQQPAAYVYWTRADVSNLDILIALHTFYKPSIVDMIDNDLGFPLERSIRRMRNGGRSW